MVLTSQTGLSSTTSLRPSHRRRVSVQELLDSSGVSPPCRAVLMLHFQEEMPLADVAAILEIPLGTVKSRLAYGLAALRRHLAEKKESPYG